MGLLQLSSLGHGSPGPKNKNVTIVHDRVSNTDKAHTGPDRGFHSRLPHCRLSEQRPNLAPTVRSPMARTKTRLGW